MTSYELTNEQILAALREAVNRDHRRRQRRRHVLVAAVLAFAITGVAVAATRTWWLDAPPATNQDVVDWQLAPERHPDGSTRQPADPKLARTVARAEGATLVAAPRENGGYCLLPQLPRERGASVGATALGFSCVLRESDGDGRGSAFGTLTAKDGWFVFGRITDGDASGLDLSAAAGRPLRVPLAANGFFIAPLPRETWARLDDRFDEIAVTAADGSVIRETCVPFSPAPYSRLEGARGGGGIAGAEGDEECARSGPIVQAPPERQPATPAPAVAGVDLVTRQHFSLSDFAGKPVVIAFWKSPCLDCERPNTVVPEELEVLYVLQGFARAHPDVGVLAINTGDALIDERVRSRLPTGYSHVADPSGRIAAAFGLGEWRTLLFLDREHRIRSRIVGEPTEPEFMRGLRMAAGEAFRRGRR